MGAVGRINDKWRGMQAVGDLNAGDQTFLDRSLGRANESIDSGVMQQQGTARTRLAQRRIGGPAAEQVLSDLGASGSIARARAAGSVADIGHSIYGSNKQFDQGRIMQGWSNDIRSNEMAEARKAAKQAAWANAIGSVAKTAGSFYGASVGVPSAGVSAPGAGYGAADNLGASLPDPFADQTAYATAR